MAAEGCGEVTKHCFTVWWINIAMEMKHAQSQPMNTRAMIVVERHCLTIVHLPVHLSHKAISIRVVVEIHACEL